MMRIMLSVFDTQPIRRQVLGKDHNDCELHECHYMGEPELSVEVVKNNMILERWKLSEYMRRDIPINSIISMYTT